MKPTCGAYGFAVPLLLLCTNPLASPAPITTPEPRICAPIAGGRYIATQLFPIIAIFSQHPPGCLNSLPISSFDGNFRCVYLPLHQQQAPRKVRLGPRFQSPSLISIPVIPSFVDVIVHLPPGSLSSSTTGTRNMSRERGDFVLAASSRSWSQRVSPVCGLWFISFQLLTSPIKPKHLFCVFLLFFSSPPIRWDLSRGPSTSSKVTGELAYFVQKI